MKTLRIISILLVAIMLFCTLASCKKDGLSDDSSDGDTVVSSDVTQNGDAPIPIKEDFEGYQFKVLTRKGGDWMSNDITAELSGNAVDQAVYIRNEKLKSKYNFSIVETKDADYLNTAQTLGAAGQYEYDMWSFKMNDIPSLGQEGYVYNLNKVSGINLDAPYYDQNTRKMGSFANYLFFITGDMLTMDDLATCICLFDLNMWEELKLTDKYGKTLYQLVDDKEWTFEKFKVLAETATTNLDGDSDMDANDRYGVFIQNSHVFNFNVGMGNSLLLKDADDVFYLNEDSGLITDLQDIISFMISSSTYTDEDLFYKGRQLFDLLTISKMPDLNSRDIEYGVVPTPMGSDDQESYYSFISTYGSNCITICSTVKDVDLTANIIELISYESMNSVTPELKNFLLGGRILNKADDARMLEIILNTKTYELSYLWNTGSLYATLRTLVDTKSTNVASAFAESREPVKASVARKLERVSRLP